MKHIKPVANLRGAISFPGALYRLKSKTYRISDHCNLRNTITKNWTIQWVTKEIEVNDKQKAINLNGLWNPFRQLQNWMKLSDFLGSQMIKKSPWFD
jgi:hypothetical protein